MVGSKDLAYYIFRADTLMVSLDFGRKTHLMALQKIFCMYKRSNDIGPFFCSYLTVFFTLSTILGPFA